MSQQGNQHARLWLSGLTLLSVLASGCLGPPSSTTFRAVGDGSGGFWEAPWPSELRRRDDGSIRVEDFPTPEEHDLVERYRAALDTDPEAGFGTSAGVYFPLAGLTLTKKQM